jgi:hypothetical protein
MENEMLCQSILIALNRHTGRLNRIGKWDLMEMVFNEKIPRELRNSDHLFCGKFHRAISFLRRKGQLIGSDNLGRYWMMDDMYEVFEMAEKFRRRGNDLFQSASRLETTGWSRFGGPSRLF